MALFKRAITKKTTKASIIKKVTKQTFVCKKDGYFPDRTNCAKYILCNGGQMSMHTCGDGLVWDAEQNFCGWPDSVECKNGKRPWEKMTDSEGGNHSKTKSLINFNFSNSNFQAKIFILFIQSNSISDRTTATRKKNQNHVGTR